MTIKDIAKLAGVSVATVSRILNDPSDSFAKPETRNKVWKIVETYNYVPNAAARNLKSRAPQKSSFSIACFVSHTRNSNENPFFSQMTRSIEQAAVQRGFTLPFYFTNFTTEDPYILEQVRSLNVNGAVCIGRFQDKNALDFLKKQFKNIVYVALSSVDAQMDQVICDGYQAALSAMNYLVEKGHRSIAYIGSGLTERRFRAYQAAIQTHKLPHSSSMICFCEYDGFSGHQAAERLLRQNKTLPSAIFCANDNTAIAVMRCLQEHNIRIPQDISLMSIDDVTMSGMVTPALTTIHVPKEEMGQVAIEVLESRLIKRHSIPLKIELPYKIVVRETVKKL